MFMDAALGVFRYRAELFLPGSHKVRSIVIPPNRHTEQSAELWGLCWAMRWVGGFCLWLPTGKWREHRWFLCARVLGCIGKTDS